MAFIIYTGKDKGDGNQRFGIVHRQWLKADLCNRIAN